MANPQKENGHIDIANEIVESLARWHLSSYENRILWVVFRKTYGWHKKDDWISLSQFCVSTGLSRPHVCRAIKMLITQNIVTKGGTKYKPLYRFQKNFDIWKSLPKGARSHHSLPKGATSVTKGGNEIVPKGAHTKETTKETTTKEMVVPTTNTFSLKEEIVKLGSGTRKDHKIIALYFIKRGWKFENKDQFNAALKRELRPASLLVGYDSEQLKECLDYCKNNYRPEMWTLETVGKRIADKVLTKII